MNSRSALGSILIYALISALPAASRAQDVTVTAGWDTAGWVRRDAALEIVVERQGVADSRLSIFIGDTDVSDLFRTTDAGLTYRPELMPLPAGASEVVAYVVDPDEGWQELARLPLQVLRKGGFEQMELTPRIDLESRALVDESAEASGAETGFRDISGQLDLGLRLVRGSGRSTAQFNVIGVSAIEQALRFGERGEDADKVDLSSYTLRLERGAGSLALGHVRFGESRHLVQGFSSRGAVLNVPLGARAELGLAAMNGTAIVGWDNFFGLKRGDHRISAARLGVELLGSRPGGLRIEVEALDGSLAPENDFNQGAINDREESSGWSLRLLSASANGRVSLDGAYAESTFTNPLDALLAQGEELVAVEEETRDARYLDIDLDLVREHQLTAGATTEWRMSLHHERVAPQYRTLATYVQSDVERNRASVNGRLGSLSIQLSGSAAEDNLDEVPSILKTRTRQQGLNLGLPLSELFMRGDEAQPRVWLPLVSVSHDRTHQYGVALPTDGGFSPSHVPDQVSRNDTGALNWQGMRWSLGYNRSRSRQDNRQPGRELADFTTDTHGVNTSLTVHAKLDVGLDWSRERAVDEEVSETARTERWGFHFNAPLHDRFTINGSASRSRNTSDPATSTSESSSVDAQAAYRFAWSRGERHGLSLQWYLRYSRQDNSFEDLVFGFADESSSWSINSGLSLSLF
jgi:hypothetical protein